MKNAYVLIYRTLHHLKDVVLQLSSHYFSIFAVFWVKFLTLNLTKYLIDSGLEHLKFSLIYNPIYHNHYYVEFRIGDFRGLFPPVFWGFGGHFGMFWRLWVIAVFCLSQMLLFIVITLIPYIKGFSYCSGGTWGSSVAQLQLLVVDWWPSLNWPSISKILAGDSSTMNLEACVARISFEPLSTFWSLFTMVGNMAEMCSALM